MVRLGPLVRPQVRWGGTLLVLGSLQFIAAMIVVQLRYPGYSDTANYVSDLGGSSSPLPWLFNGSVILLGVFGVAGTVLMRSAFPTKTAARLGLALLVIADASAVLVGVFPERYASLHSLFSASTFIASGLALLFLALAMLRDTRWDGYRAYTLFSGVVTLVGLALFSAHVGGGGEQGLWERVIVAPLLLWAILAGLHLARMPTFAPSVAPTGGYD